MHRQTTSLRSDKFGYRWATTSAIGACTTCVTHLFAVFSAISYLLADSMVVEGFAVADDHLALTVASHY